MSNSTQNAPKQGLAKIIKFEIEEVPDGYVRPYILLAKPKHPLKVMSFVEDMQPTQEETFTKEEYPLIMFGFSNKYRQGFYVKKEFETMLESLFKEFMLLEYARGKADVRREVIEKATKELDRMIKVELDEFKATDYREGITDGYKYAKDVLATLREEEGV